MGAREPQPFLNLRTLSTGLDSNFCNRKSLQFSKVASVTYLAIRYIHSYMYGVNSYLSSTPTSHNAHS